MEIHNCKNDLIKTQPIMCKECPFFIYTRLESDRATSDKVICI